MTVTIDDIRAAQAIIDGVVIRTPTVPSRTLSEMLGAQVVLKFENLQYTGSFKDRRALVKLSSLSEDECKAGVIAASAGNHAQGVAYHAQRLGIPATIVMPRLTPFTKVLHTRNYGADVILEGEDLSAATDAAHDIADREGRTFVHPYDDPQIVAGQGTIALEMLAADPGLEVLIVPIGGGLIAGCAIAAKSVKPEIEVVGVEAALYPSMYQAVHGQPATSGGRTIAEGIAVKSPGKLTRRIIDELVSDILLVAEDVLEQAVQMILEIEKSVAEGAGAAALAALIEHPGRFAGRRVGILVSGGNIDSRLLASVLLRGLVREGRLIRLRIQITDAPGTLGTVAQCIGESGGDIVEIYHQRLFRDVPVKLAELDVVLETRDLQHTNEIVQRLEEAGFDTRILSGTARDPG